MDRIPTTMLTARLPDPSVRFVCSASDIDSIHSPSKFSGLFMLATMYGRRRPSKTAFRQVRRDFGIGSVGRGQSEKRAWSPTARLGDALPWWLAPECHRLSKQRRTQVSHWWGQIHSVMRRKRLRRCLGGFSFLQVQTADLFSTDFGRLRHAPQLPPRHSHGQ
jgi:hypothetical protein